MRTLVVGGTGTVGRPLTAELVRRGHEVRVLSRSGGTAGATGAVGYRGDVAAGTGVDEAVACVDAVVDCLNVETVRRGRAEAVLVRGTRRLLDAGAGAGVHHHVLLSIVGIDRIPYPYYAAKLRQEEAVTAGPVPSTVLRATPFHEFVATVARRGRVGPFVLVPRLRTAPVAAVEVARALADAVEGGPCGRAPDIWGPREEEFVDLVRVLLRARGDRGVVVPVVWPGRAGRAMRDGAQLPTGGRRGHQSFDEWLAEHHGPGGTGAAGRS